MPSVSLYLVLPWTTGRVGWNLPPEGREPLLPNLRSINLKGCRDLPVGDGVRPVWPGKRQEVLGVFRRHVRHRKYFDEHDTNLSRVLERIRSAGLCVDVDLRIRTWVLAQQQDDETIRHIAIASHSL